MAQFDLLLTQNIALTGIEFSEKYVLIAKGGLMSAIADGTPAVLAAGINGHHLVRDDAEVTGLKWVAIPATHAQNTDIGTTSNIFEIDTDGFKIEITAESASKLGIKVDGGATYADFQAKDATFAKVTVAAAPSAGNDLTNKTYVDGILSAADAMIFKGTIGTAGTHEIAAFNALTTYNAGWTYRVITAGTIRDIICEIGDLVMVIVDRTGIGNVNTDFTTAQTNLDGAVIGPASTTDNFVALFNGATGKLIKAGTGALGTAAYTATADYVTKALFDAQTILVATADNTPAALTVGEQTFVGRKTGGNIAALTPTEARAILNVADNANAYVHPNHSGDVTSAGDGAQTIATAAVTLAKMSNLAQNSLIGRVTALAGVPEALTAANVMTILWQTAPATKTTIGTPGWIARDANWFYICTATNIWKRSPIATNW